MEILTLDQLPQGGFAGLKEKQVVTDYRVFGARKRPEPHRPRWPHEVSHLPVWGQVP